MATMSPDGYYRLVHIGYSHYDGASIFRFECINSGDCVAWWWFDSSDEALSDGYFEQIG